MMHLHVALVVLVSGAWSLDRGLNQSPPGLRAYGVLNSSFKLGQNVTMTCGDKTWTKNRMLFIVWNVKLKHKSCNISFNIDGQNKDDCRDHKSLTNTSEFQPILHIPQFNLRDVGVYTCESVYSGGVDTYTNYISITAPPTLSSWIEWRDDRKVAVCRAERGNPAANISWSFRNNSTGTTLLESDGLITVESSVELSTHDGPENISCTVTHLYWDRPQVIVPELIKNQPSKYNHSVALATITISVVFCLALLFLGIKKLVHLRGCKRSSSKSPSNEDVEEVEPYESYVQRVNSIYNSRDFFK